MDTRSPVCDGGISTKKIGVAMLVALFVLEAIDMLLLSESTSIYSNGGTGAQFTDAKVKQMEFFHLWWENCREPVDEAGRTAQLTTAMPVSKAEASNATSTGCCRDLLNGNCVHDFDAMAVERFKTFGALCPTGSTEVLQVVRTDCLKAARIAACGEPAPIDVHRRCPKKPELCAAKDDVSIGDGYDIHPQATQRRESLLHCLVSLPDHPEPAELHKCLMDMQAPIACKHLEEFGAIDSSKICITQALLASTCVVYSVGVGYIWQVENELADYLPNCRMVMFDPTPQAGPNERVDFSQIPSPVYEKQIRQSGVERHQNIMMMHTGVADTDHVGLFSNHFVKGAGVRTGFLTMRTAVSMLSHANTKPAYLKLDVEGFEFHLIDQLLAERIPQLGVDFHSYDLAEVKRAMIKFHLAGYDPIAGLDTNLVVAGRVLLHVKYLLTREHCTELPRPDFTDLHVPGTCFYQDAAAFGGEGVLQANLDASSPEFCQLLCANQGARCVAFTFTSVLKKCELRKTLLSKHGDAQPYIVRSKAGSTCGPRVCPPTGPTEDVVEP